MFPGNYIRNERDAPSYLHQLVAVYEDESREAINNQRVSRYSLGLVEILQSGQFMQGLTCRYKWHN